MPTSHHNAHISPAVPAPLEQAASAGISMPGDMVIGTAILPHSILAAALAGHYVDLCLFADHHPSEPDTFALKNGKLTVSSKRTWRVVHSNQAWLKAWANYEELLVTMHPDGSTIYKACLIYRRLIHDNQAMHTWPAVHSFDTSF